MEDYCYNKVVEKMSVDDFILLFSDSESCDNWFSKKEMELFPFPERAKSLAARYLVKKAISSTFKMNNQLNTIEILNNSLGKPEIEMGDSWKRAIESNGFKKILCSLSHSRNHAIGMTIFCY